MEHWPGHEKHEGSLRADKPKGKGKKKEHRRESNFWQWPHLEHGSIGGTALVMEDGRVQWSSVVNTSHDTRWLPLGRPVKVFPETRPPQVDTHEHSVHHCAEKGIQYLRTYFPDADFPSDLLGDTLEADAREMRRLRAFDPLLGNLLEVIPCHHTQNESTVVFPMGKLGRELNISRFSSDRLGNMVFNPAGSPSFAFETPILQISSAVGPSEWIATPFSTLLIRTYTSSSLLHLEHSKVTRKLDITRSQTGGVPIVDSRILASGPDILVVNRSGEVYKCNTYHGDKAMQLVGAHEGNDDDHFWQLGITGRNDECFLTSCKAVKHIDLRSPGRIADVFSLDHLNTIVTSFESPMHDYISRITTTSDVLWLDDRFRRRPLLSFKHYRSFDRTLRVLTAGLSVSFSLLTSRSNSLVTLYDINRGSDGLLHCNSMPSCLPHSEPMFTAYDGYALVTLSSDVDLTFFRLCQRGSIHRQDIRVIRPDEDQPGSTQESHVTHQWDEDVQTLERQVDQLQIDFGPAGERHYTKVNLRGAYEKMFAIPEDSRESANQNEFKDTLARLPDIWHDTKETVNNMLTMFDVLSGIRRGDKYASQTDFPAGTNVDSKQVFEALMRGQIATQELSGLAQWHYNIQDTSIPALNYHSINCSALDEYLKGLNVVSGAERYDPSVQRETEAREQLVVDLVLSNDVYSSRQFSKTHSFATGEATNTATHPTEMTYSEEPPEVKFGYFRPIRKSGADHYADKNQDGGQDPGVSSPLGVRLLLAEWELGTDPRDYKYRDPYGVADRDEQPIPQYRRPIAAPPMTQKKQVHLERPPAVIATATQLPVVQTVLRAPTTVQSQAVERTQSQQFQPNLDAFSQEPVMSTQVLPGPFGGRPAAGKKPAKKRIGGF